MTDQGARELADVEVWRRPLADVVDPAREVLTLWWLAVLVSRLSLLNQPLHVRHQAMQPVRIPRDGCHVADRGVVVE